MNVIYAFNFNWSKADRYQRDLKKKEIQATHDFLEKEVYTPSQRDVPVRTGKLKASGKITDPQSTSHGFIMRVTYGDDEAYYALFVHDGTKFMQGRKFLEKHALAAKPKYAGYMQRALR